MTDEKRLQEQINRCRRLIAAATDEKLKEDLPRLAAEYQAELTVLSQLHGP